jgi:hypothetical protein
VLLSSSFAEDKKKPYYLPPASASLSAGFSSPYGSPASMSMPQPPVSVP